MSELVPAEEGRTLAQLDEAKRQIALAREMSLAEDLKDWRDKAAAMVHYAKKQGDSCEMLAHATQIKIEAEAALGAIDREARPDKVKASSRSSLVTKDDLPELGVSTATRAAWRKLGKAYDEGKLDDLIETVKAEADTLSTAAVVKALKSESMGVHYSSETDEWATPQGFFDAVNREFNFDLDVCALPSSAKCDRYFTPDDDGLAQEWTGSVWMNPPYGSEIVDWVKKAHDSAVDGTTVVALVPARVDTHWWWNHCRFAEIRFIKGRLKFGNVGTAAPFPSALVVFGRPAGVVWWEYQQRD